MNWNRLDPEIHRSFDGAERFAHARDLWPRATLALRHGGEPPSPEAILFPADERQVEACVRWATEETVPLIPWGAGSGVCGAAAGRVGSVTLDLKRLRWIDPVDPATRTVRVGAGVLGQHLEDQLEAQGYATRHSPSSIWCSTVGGWAASRSAGQFSSKYGKFEDMVRALRVVSPARTFGTGAWAEGTDLQDWVMGAEGALGVITELLVEVVPLPKVRRARGYRFPDAASAWGAMRALMQAELHPAAVRLYDDVDTRVGGRLAKKSAPAAKGASWLHRVRERIDASPWLSDHALSLPLSLPRLVNRVARGISEGCLLIVAWEGEDEPTRILAEHGHRILCERGEDLGGEPGEHWYAHRHDVSYKLAPVFQYGGFADTMEVAALWSRLPALYTAVRAALGKHALVMAHFSHVWREGCSIYFSFAGKGDLETYDAAWRDALAAAASVGATVAHHHGVGQLKMEAAAREMSGIAPIFAAIKRDLDPAGILNPGRMLPERPHHEPPAPAIGIDEESQVATLDAQQAASERDAWLAQRGWALRFPCVSPLAEAPQRGRPWENPLLGCSVRTPLGRVVLLPTPRTAAGPDPRRCFAARDYETVTVPVVSIGEAAIIVPRVAEDVRPARTLATGLELRGPAAADLSRLT